MPRRGGEADKLGNRYESLWTVDAVLDLIDGGYVDLVVEPVGEEATGVEFVRTGPSGIREYHSIKRQQGDGNWTLSRLASKGTTGRSILGDLFAKVGTRSCGIFSSGTSASDLDELIQRALASDSFEEFERRIRESGRLSGEFDKHVVPICSDGPSAYMALKHLEVRTANERELDKRVEQRVRSMFRMANGEPLDAKATQLLIGDFVINSLGRTIRAETLLSELKEHRVLRLQLAGDRTVAERVQQLNSAYLNEVNDLLINRAKIIRRESAAAITTLLGDSKSVMLEGTAGGGKSCALAQVLDQLAAQDVPSLVVRLDRLTEDDQSAQAIGTRRGLPDSPVITLGELAGDRPAVLCIDQLDALSFVSARQQWAWSAFNALRDEARAYPNMRLLFSCRSFDLEQDARLRALVADQDRVERIRVEKLDDDTVRSAIEASGVAAQSLSQEQLRILATPLHLYLFLEASRAGAVDFAAANDLFDAFWKHKQTAVDNRLGARPSTWTPVIAALCDALSARESLVTPAYSLDAYSETVEAMASEAVVYIQDGAVRFFHEAFFDYAFARTFLRADKGLVHWLVSDEQPLFRRSQVRQVLTFLRDRESDKGRYLQTIEGLLGDERVRFHIKKLVLDWLGALGDPTEDEWRIIERSAQTLGDHGWNFLFNSVPWFDVLQGMEKWGAWLGAENEWPDRAIRLLRAPNVLDARSAKVAELVAPFRGRSDIWRKRLQWLAQGAFGHTSSEMEALLVALITDGTLDDARPGIAVNDDWWSLLYGSSTEAPEFTVRVLGAWFDRQLDRAGELGRDDPFDAEPELVTYSQSSGDVISACSTRAPHEFVRELFPRFVLLDRRAPRPLIAMPGDIGTPEEQLREALAEAMNVVARDDPATLDSIVETAGSTDSRWMSALLLRVWSANPSFYAEQIVRYLLEQPDQRLNIGYDFSIGQTDSFVAVSRTAVAAASPICSEESFAALEGAILCFTTNRERERRLIGRTRLALLRALPRERIGKAVQEQLRELERRFPDAPEHGAPEPPKEDDMGTMMGPPISLEAQAHMSDEQWLSAMAKYRSDGPTIRGDQFVGGSVEISRGLEQLVRKNPGRFASLARQMDTTLPPVYFEAILRGLTRSEGNSGRAGTPAQACMVLRRLEELDVRVRGAEVAHAIRALANAPLPDDVVQMLCRIALNDPEPETDNWQDTDEPSGPIFQAINSARGAAALALAQLLFADRNRWSSLRPAVQELVSDPVLAVRSVAVQCLLAVLDTNRLDALALFAKLTEEKAEAVLGTRYIERFIHYAMFRDYPAMRPTLQRMLMASHPATMRTGARQTILAALSVDEAREDANRALAMGEEVRVGAAEIYARNISNETVGAECERHLRMLFMDESEAVRRAARTCWTALAPDQIASRGSLIGVFARSPAFGTGSTVLMHRLQEAQRPLPREVCDLAERAVTAYGAKAASIQFAEAGDASELSKLLVRLHEETSDRALRKRILNAIDEMMRAGFYGLDDQLKQQFDR